MLILRACSDGQNVMINDLARQLFIKHNSAVGLADRLVKEGFVVREPSRADRRKVHLQLTARGRNVLAKLASIHRRELQRIGPMLEKILGELSRDLPAED
jgi:DNA-binding MarR family transcriptional regulator